MQNSVIDNHIANYTLSSDIGNLNLVAKHLNIHDYFTAILSLYTLEFTEAGKLQFNESAQINPVSPEHVKLCIEHLERDIKVALELYEANLYSRNTVEEGIAIILIGLLRSKVIKDPLKVFTSIHEDVIKKHRKINPTSQSIIEKYFKGKEVKKKLAKTFPYNLVSDAEYVYTFTSEYNVDDMWKLYSAFRDNYIATQRANSFTFGNYEESLIFFKFNSELNGWNFRSLWAKRKCFIKNTNAKVREHIKKFREESEDFSESKTNLYTIKLR